MRSYGRSAARLHRLPDGIPNCTVLKGIPLPSVIRKPRFMSACAALYAGVDAGMPEHERYLFDLQGYVVVPNALDAAEVAALNAIVDMQIAALPDGDWSTHRFMEPLTWGAPFRDVIDHPRVLPYVQDIVAPQVRIDHTYLDIIRSGINPSAGTLHGGGTPFDPGQFFDLPMGGCTTAWQ